MSAIDFRPAIVEDAAEIHELLLCAAADLPLLVDTLEREEALYALVRQAARGGESWVAADGEKRIVGVALAELNQRGRHYAESEVLELRHAALMPPRRDAGILEGLIGKITARMLPVVATVSPQNRTGLAAALQKLGFHESEGVGARRFYWGPGTR